MMSALMGENRRAVSSQLKKHDKISDDTNPEPVYIYTFVTQYTHREWRQKIIIEKVFSHLNIEPIQHLFKYELLHI